MPVRRLDSRRPHPFRGRLPEGMQNPFAHPEAIFAKLFRTVTCSSPRRATPWRPRSMSAWTVRQAPWEHARPAVSEHDPGRQPRCACPALTVPCGFANGLPDAFTLVSRPYYRKHNSLIRGRGSETDGLVPSPAPHLRPSTIWLNRLSVLPSFRVSSCPHFRRECRHGGITASNGPERGFAPPRTSMTGLATESEFERLTSQALAESTQPGRRLFASATSGWTAFVT